MKKILILFIIILAFNAYAEDQWLCTEDQAFKDGNAYSVCGVGTSSDEGEARQRALINSMQEFRLLCSNSESCKGRKFNVIPKRSTCYENKNAASYSRFTCHRLLMYEVL